MKTFWVISTYLCNLRCTYCHNNQTGHVPVSSFRRTEAITLRLVNSCTESLKLGGYDGVALSGGEPLISASAVDWIRETRCAGLRLRIITNLTYLPSKTLEELEHHNNVTVAISFGGLNRQDHDKNRGGWNEMMINLQKLRRRDIRTELIYVLGGTNVPNMHRLECLAAVIGSDIHIVPVSFTGNESAEIPARAIAKGIWDQMISDTCHPRLSRDLQFYRSFYDGNLELRICDVLKTSLVMDPLGDIYGCFFRPDLIYGNIRETSLLDIIKKVECPKICNNFGDQCLGLNS